MRILIAPDGFKGSLSSKSAAEAIRRGAARACPGARVDVCPLSDGGEGLSSVLVSAAGGTVRTSRVTGPLGEAVDASWTLIDGGRTALIESAAVIGLGLVPEERRAATRTTTYGVGELVREALGAGVSSVIVGLGGTATTDGGAGMAQALGVRFEGAGTPATGGELGRVRLIDLAGRDPRLSSVAVIGLTDVDNPLAGPQGAAHVYAEQKGANEAERVLLDGALAHLSTLVGDAGTCPGDGAAGGLGFGLRVFAGATLRSGIDHVLHAVGFDERLARCDLVLTGEGRLDAQSARGKVMAGVSRRARTCGVPVVALVGAIGPGADALYEEGLTARFSLCAGPTTESDAKRDAARLLEALAYDVVRLRGAG